MNGTNVFFRSWLKKQAWINYALGQVLFVLFNRQNDSHISTIQTPCWKSPPPNSPLKRLKRPLKNTRLRIPQNHHLTNEICQNLSKNAQKVFLGLFLQAAQKNFFKLGSLWSFCSTKKKSNNSPPPPPSKNFRSAPYQNTSKKLSTKFGCSVLFPCALKYQNVFEPDELWYSSSLPLSACTLLFT